MEIGSLIFLFIVAIAVLVKSSGYFTDSSEKIGLALGASPFIIGVTIVTVGTTLPELISSVIAVFSNASEIVAGNVIGSNIANILLILGVAAIVGKKIKIDFDIVRVDLPFLLGSAFLLAMVMWDSVITWAEGALLLVGLFIYIVYTIRVAKKPKDKRLERAIKDEVPKGKERKVTAKTILILIASAIGIYIGARLTVEAVIEISKTLNIGKEIIAITAVALGTSLPELFVSIQAARKGKPEIAVGNILGANIFNTFAAVGIPSLFGALAVPASILTFALPVMLIATFLYVFVTQDREITLWEGYLLLIFYLLFIGKVTNFL